MSHSKEGEREVLLSEAEGPMKLANVSMAELNALYMVC